MFVLILMQPLFLKCAEIKANAMFAFKGQRKHASSVALENYDLFTTSVCFEHISIVCTFFNIYIDIIEFIDYTFMFF